MPRVDLIKGLKDALMVFAVYKLSADINADTFLLVRPLIIRGSFPSLILPKLLFLSGVVHAGKIPEARHAEGAQQTGINR